jgi:chromosomal replication initiation ATPase DnaA
MTPDDGMVLSLWRGLVPLDPPGFSAMKAVTKRVYNEILDRVECETGTSREAIAGRSRYAEIVRARQYAMWLFRQRLDKWGRPVHSYPLIGAAMDLDHTTVLWGVRAHQARLDALNVEVAA